MGQTVRDFHFPGRSRAFATHAMCATSHPLAAQTAIELLKAGGNAVDAAIGAAVLLGFCEPQMTGIGGDCFALIKPAGSEDVLALNGSGRAPRGLDAAKLRAAGHRTMPVYGVETVTVPGAIDAFCRLSADHGRLELARVLAPAIHYAEEGVPVTARTAFDWARASHLVGDAQRFFLIDGAPPAEGQVFRAPGQAQVLRLIAERGRDGFYRGEVAADMVDSLAALGGSHTLEDFEATACEYTTPVAGDYRGTELVEHPPNGQGATAILLANILAHFDLASMDPGSVARAHLEAEAAKLAYDARNRFIADADHVTRLEHMLAPETARALAGLIRMDRALDIAPGVTEAIHKDTVYLTVVDRDRMAVSLIYSIYHGFGSGLASARFGINFQNRGAGFTLEPGHPNEAGGGKRPLHTIIPAMLREGGRVTMPFGVMGGGFQPCGHVRLMSNLKDFGMDIQAAIDAPRCFPDAGVLKVERGYDDAFRAALSDLGHRVEVPEVPLGGAQAIILRDDGLLEGGTDQRKDGCALGY